jgi:hypothetical protein
VSLRFVADQEDEEQEEAFQIHRSSRPSSYDPNNIIPARIAVFATDELLSLILSNVSKEDLGTSAASANCGTPLHAASRSML